MQFQTPFDATTVEPSSFTPPPVMGQYHVRVTDSEPKGTADGTGGYLLLTLEILDPGPYLNRKIPYVLNLYNKNQQTCEIAFRQLSALCYVTGQIKLSDTRQLFNIPFIATIGPQKENPTYTNVFGVMDVNGNPPGKTGATAAAPIPAPAAAAAAPWGAPAPAAAPAATTPPWGAPAPAPTPAPAAYQPPAAAQWGAPAPAPAAAPAAAPVPVWQPGAAAAATPPWVK